VKRFGQAKQRLLETLDRPQRAAVVKAMLTDVLAAVSETEAIERIIVVTGEGRAERIALRHAQRSTTPLEVMRDPDDRGHSEAATLGIIRALALGAECSALLPGDCPLLDPAEVEAALAEMSAGSVSIVPDRHGTGTNGLLLRPPDAIEPAFGEGSRGRHEALALAADRQVTVERIPSLALDIDAPEDLAELRDVLGRSPRRAPRTADALDAIQVEPVAGDPAA